MRSLLSHASRSTPLVCASQGAKAYLWHLNLGGLRRLWCLRLGGSRQLDLGRLLADRQAGRAGSGGGGEQDAAAQCDGAGQQALPCLLHRGD